MRLIDKDNVPTNPANEQAWALSPILFAHVAIVRAQGD